MKVVGKSTKYPISEATGCFTHHVFYRTTNNCAPFRSGEDTSNGIPAVLITSLIDDPLGFKEGTVCLCDSDACNTGTIAGNSRIVYIILTVGSLLSVYYSCT